MAGHANEPLLPVKPKPPPTTTVFFRGWFGCSNRNSVAIIQVAAPDHNHPSPIWEKKEKPGFPNRSMKNPAAAAAAPGTAPLAETNSSQDDRRKSTDLHRSKFVKWKTNCKASKKSHPAPAAAAEEKKASSASLAVAGEVAPPLISEETPGTGSPGKDNIMVTQNGVGSENHGDVVSSKNGTCKKRLSFCRKKAENGDKSKTGSSSSQPGSPVSKPNPQAQHGGVLISRSTTFPALDLYHVHPIIAAATNNNNDNKNYKIAPVKATAKVAVAGARRNQNKEEGELDPVVGLSIIAVTLVIMVVWGRFCAIVCTAAWLYFVPRLRTSLSEVKVRANHGKNSGSILERAGSELGGSGRPDLDSVEYKRRVVLEGLLERNRRPIT